MLLAAQFGNPHDERVVPAAAAIELTHLATLYHDDVMDEAPIRRGHQSANSRWTNTIAILTGDFLFARASQILADLGAEAIRIQADTFTRLVSGQIAETVGPRPGQDPLAHYLRVVEDKTASLIATAGRFGAMFSGAPAERGGPDRARLRGDRRGLAAVRRHPRRGQRVRGVRQDARHRPAGGNAEPAGAARAAAPAGPADARLRELLASADLTDETLHAEALALLRAHPAMDGRARGPAAAGPRWPRAEIAGLPDVPARAAFEALCDYVVDRTG